MARSPMTNAWRHPRMIHLVNRLNRLEKIAMRLQALKIPNGNFARRKGYPLTKGKSITRCRLRCCNPNPVRVFSRPVARGARMKRPAPQRNNVF